MLVTNQDRDRTLLINKVSYKKHYYKGSFYGWNIYGHLWLLRELLGTYDSEADCEQICREMNRFEHYTMPEPADWEVEL